MKNVVRVAYFEKDNTALIAGPVRTLVEMLRCRVDITQIFVLPHWKQGPHLDLVIECDSTLFDAEIFPLCQVHLRVWLQQHPSTTTLDPVAYEQLSQQLALVEIEPPPYLPLLDNNSVTRASYRQNSTLKLQQFMDLKAQFLHETSPLVFELLELKQHAKGDFFVGLCLLLAGCGTAYSDGGLSRGFNSFRSHAEFFLVHYDRDGRLRQHFDAVAEKYAAAVRPSIAAILAGNLAEVTATPVIKSVFDRWMPLVQRYEQAIRKIVAENYEFLAGEEIFVDNLKSIAQHIPAHLHQNEKKGPMAIAIEQDEGQKMLKSPEFMAYRTLVNFFYFLLPPLNISPLEKYCICNMTAAAVETILDISWRDLMIPGYTEARRVSV